MNIIVKEYQSKDLDAVVALNRRLTDKWFHYTFIGEDLVKQEEDSVNLLSNFEQWYHGGPWNNAQILKLYVELVDLCQGKIFLAWNEYNELVGEIDCCVADNYNNRGYILWILTDPNYRKQGIGRQLIDHCVSFFKKNAITSVIVIPEDENAAIFYRNIGFVPHEKQIQVEICTKNHIPLTTIIKKFSITPIFSYELVANGLLAMYPLIGSTGSNNYIVQTTLYREKIIEVLGWNIANNRFLPVLWRLKKGKLVAIFGNVYQLRVWVSQNALMDEKFICDIFQCIKSLQVNTSHLDSLTFFLLEKDYKYIRNIDCKIIKEELIYVLNEISQ